MPAVRSARVRTRRLPLPPKHRSRARHRRREAAAGERIVSQRRLEQAGFVFIALSLGLVQLKLQLGQGVFFTLAAFTWLILIVREGRTWDALKPGRGTPAFFLPLMLYAGWTLASAAMSSNR